MKVLVSGSTGLVGQELCDFLSRSGHEVFRLVRQKKAGTNEIRWNIKKNLVDTEALEAAGIDAVIHLAGESIVGFGWSTAKKNAIKESRIAGTRLLSTTLAQLENKPHTFITASATGYYGNRGDELLTEMDAAGSAIHREPRNRPFFLMDEQWGPRFLSDVCQAWENAAEPAAKAGIRVAHMRTGIVLDKEGGALKYMLPAFKLGVAGPLGSGNQYMSWISLPDLVSAYVHVLNNPDISGPVNAVAPNPATNKEFTKSLSKKAFIVPMLGDFANFVPTPGIALKASPFGEMANGLFLSSTRVKPLVLEESGFRFNHPHLPEALAAVL